MEAELSGAGAVGGEGVKVMHIEMRGFLLAVCVALLSRGAGAASWSHSLWPSSESSVGAQMNVSIASTTAHPLGPRELEGRRLQSYPAGPWGQLGKDAAHVGLSALNAPTSVAAATRNWESSTAQLGSIKVYGTPIQVNRQGSVGEKMFVTGSNEPVDSGFVSLDGAFSSVPGVTPGFPVTAFFLDLTPYFGSAVNHNNILYVLTNGGKLAIWDATIFSSYDRFTNTPVSHTQTGITAPITSSPAYYPSSSLIIIVAWGEVQAWNDLGNLNARTRAWSQVMNSGFNSQSSPALDGVGNIYAMCDDGSLYAYDISGTLLWSTAVGGDGTASPTYDSVTGLVFVATSDRSASPTGNGAITALYTVTGGGNTRGAIKWTYALSGWGGPGAPILYSGFVYAGDSSGRVYKVTAATGALVATSTQITAATATGSTPADFGSSPSSTFYGAGALNGFAAGSGAMSADGILYLPGSDGALYAFDASTLNVLWGSPSNPPAGLPAVSIDSVGNVLFPSGNAVISISDNSQCQTQVGYYVPFAFGTCTLCAAGNYCPGGGVTITCPVNAFCPSGASAPTACRRCVGGGGG